MDIEDCFKYNPEDGSFERIGSHKMDFNSKGRVSLRLRKDGYYDLKFGNKRYLAHRLAWYLYYGRWPDRVIDHINRVRTDNCIENLRDVSRRENSQNVENFKYGVQPNSSGKRWSAKITVNNKPKYIGTYDTQEEARDAYNQHAAHNVEPMWDE